MDRIQGAKKVSIRSYLEKIGVKVFKKGGKYICSSPFTRDSTPSFTIYSNNTFYDFSSGEYGDVIDLVRSIESCGFNEAVDLLTGGKFKVLSKKEMYKKTVKKDFKLSDYKLYNKKQCGLVKEYAKKRSINRDFVCAKFPEFIGGVFVDRIGLGFIHVDQNFNVCGIKIRKIVDDNPRFSARGSMMYYILKNVPIKSLDNHEFWLYVVESESSANSAFEFLDKHGVPCVVISFGSVNRIPKYIPESITSNCTESYLMIDFDGDKELYEKRIKMYDHLNLIPKKIELKKGQDLNSLYSSGEINKYKDIILPK